MSPAPEPKVVAHPMADFNTRLAILEGRYHHGDILTSLTEFLYERGELGEAIDWLEESLKS